MATFNVEKRTLKALKQTELDTKVSISDFVFRNMKDIQAIYDSLEPKEKLDYLERLIKYVVSPKRDKAPEIEPQAAVILINGNKYSDAANRAMSEGMRTIHLMKPVEISNEDDSNNNDDNDTINITNTDSKK